MNVIITPLLVGFKVYSLILLPASFSHAGAQEQLKYRSSVRKMEHLTSKNLHGRRWRERHITADVPEKNPVLAFKNIYMYWQQRDGQWCHHLHKWSLRRKKKWKSVFGQNGFVSSNSCLSAAGKRKVSCSNLCFPSSICEVWTAHPPLTNVPVSLYVSAYCTEPRFSSYGSKLPSLAAACGKAQTPSTSYIAFQNKELVVFF